MPVFDRLKNIIVDELSDADPASITPEARFIEDLGCDSFDVAQIIVSIEEAFGIEIPLDAAEQISTVGEAVSAIEGALGAKG